MLCSTFGHGKVADADSAKKPQASPSHAKHDQRRSTSPGLMSPINPAWSQDNQARTNPHGSSAARPVNTTNFTAPEIPASPHDGRGLPAVGGKRSMTASKTSFQLAHPPPAIKHRQRFNIRPKILLQLQQISDATRPIPVLDVVPSFVFAPKLARKFPSIFKGKEGLGADDLVIVNSQNYNSSHDAKGQMESISNEDSWETREIVAAICPPKKRMTGVEDFTEICLTHGAVWKASPLSTGAYEFQSVDERGNRIMARWVPRPPLVRRRTYNGQATSNLSPAEQRRFIFSIINPDSRRHPVIASLSRSSIDISDQYSVPPVITRSQSLNSSQDHQPSAPESPNVYSNEYGSSKMAMIETDERLRSLIIITGIWVAFMEGFSPNFQYNKPASSTVQGVNPAPSHKARSLSVNLAGLGKGRTSIAESPKREPILRTQSATENFSSTLPVIPSPHTPPSTGAASFQRANTRRPDLSTKTFQANPVILSPPNHWQRVRLTQESPTSSLENWTSARVLSNKPTTSKKRDLWDQNSVHELVAVQSPGSVGRKPTKLNKLLGLIKRTSGAH